MNPRMLTRKFSTARTADSAASRTAKRRPVLGRLSAFGAAAFIAVTWAGTTPQAEEIGISDESIVNVGSYVYQKHCAECHGADAAGGAVTGPGETVEAPALTGLAKANAGVFPFWELYEQISGTELLPAHGSRHMPVWGEALALEGAAAGTGRVGRDQAMVARGRILALMAYLSTLQKP